MIKKREKKFNTAGPGQPDINYVYNPLKRINLEELEALIEDRRYFVLHAPRQSGKTSCLLALRDYLNEQGEYVAVYCNVESGQAMRNNVASVIDAAMYEIAKRTSYVLNDEMPMLLAKELEGSDASKLLNLYISKLCNLLEKPLVLFLDEIDALIGDSLISVLRQLRAGYDSRPQNFPLSVILCGVRDVRDYRIHTGNGEIITGGSAFNIKAESLRLGNFTREEIYALYQMHTDETGQVFEPECFDFVWKATEGQPWLVNALAHEVTWKMKENRDRSIHITAEMIYKAQEQLIYRRETHLDILIDKLREDRVRRVIQPLLTCEDGTNTINNVSDDDIQYTADMGLITYKKPYRISNAIYREIIPRELTWATQCVISDRDTEWYINEDNSLNMFKLLEDFQRFFRQNADSWIQTFDYHEAGPQLLLQAYLQRIVNGGGYIDREYGLGRRRTDLLIRKPLTDGYGGPMQYIVLELKIKRGDLEETIQKGLEQTAWYMDSVGIPELREGHFIVFNRDKGAEWDDKIFHETREYNGRTIEVWGM